METIDFNEVIRDPETISVVGELLYLNKGLPYKGKQTFSDFNDAENGIWWIYGAGSVANTPFPNGYGILVCIKAENFTVQEAFNYNSSLGWRRHKADNGIWTSWKSI